MFKEDISLDYYQLKSVTGHKAWCSPQINEHWSEGVIVKELQSLLQRERTTIMKPASNNYIV